LTLALFPRIVTKNWQLKLAALAMAVLLWTVPRFDAQSRQVMDDVPVRVRLNDPQFALVGEPFPSTVQVTLSGPARALFALEVDRPSVVVPVDRVSSADTAVLLLLQWLRIPEGEGVVVEEFRPQQVRLAFEPLEVGALALSPRFTGSLPEGLSLAQSPTVSPELVRASGPASRLEAMDSLPLLALDLAGVEQSGAYRQAVDTAGLPGLVVSPREATVHLRVEETVERVIGEVPVILPLLPEDPQLQARPATVRLVLTGARSLVQGVDSLTLRATLPREGVPTPAPGEETRVELVLEGLPPSLEVRVQGLPPLVEARLDPPTVVLRRPAGR
jgi:YbbR domain-containing protein